VWHSGFVSPVWVERSRFAVGHFLGCAVFPQRGWLVTYSASSPALSSSFTFLQSFVRQSLADPTHRTSTSHGLLLPTALAGSKVHLPQALPARYVPPSGFGYPLDGLLPSVPCRFCFTPAALLGFALRSCSPSRGTRHVSAPGRPTYRLSRRYTPRHSAWPARQAAVPGL
jgi:hypothetical protein